MTLTIQAGKQTMTAWDIIPRLSRYQMLPQLIKESIIDNAIANIECTPEEISFACEQFDRQNQLTTEEQREVWGRSRGLDREDMLELATRFIKIAKFKQQKWGEDLNRYFLDRKDSLDKIIFSIIRVADMGLAQELYFRIQEGQSFAELAKQFSQGREAIMGGVVNPVELGKLPPAMAKLLSSREDGALLLPFPMGDKIVIIRVEKISRAELDAATRQRLLEEQFQSWLQEEFQQQENGVSLKSLVFSS